MQIFCSKLKTLAVSVCLSGLLAGAAGGQATGPTPPRPAPAVPGAERRMPPSPPSPREPERVGLDERALSVHPNVNISLPCVSDARVTVNGWDRNEIRIFVKNGNSVAFKIHERDAETGKPVWVAIGRRPAGARTAPFGECISGERIDIEVPVGASLNIVGRAADARVDTVRKITIKTAGGNVSLRNVAGGIMAETYEGDVTVENSAGQISLKSSTGNIIAFEVSPGQVGDLFKASTNSGTVTLQRVEHRQIDASSVSGSLLFNGKILSGGVYKFKTANGAMRIAVPAASSYRMAAWYGFGTIESELPMRIITENVSAGGKSMNAMFGEAEGAATVNLTTNSGKISITKQ
jgi:DUF4097 and DUF4098 domain-containing protein YvlB